MVNSWILLVWLYWIPGLLVNSWIAKNTRSNPFAWEHKFQWVLFYWSSVINYQPIFTTMRSYVIEAIVPLVVWQLSQQVQDKPPRPSNASDNVSMMAGSWVKSLCRWVSWVPCVWMKSFGCWPFGRHVWRGNVDWWMLMDVDCSTWWLLMAYLIINVNSVFNDWQRFSMMNESSMNSEH